MAQIHKLVDVNWFFGIPFLSTDSDGNAGLVVQNAMSILAGNLLGLQMANEPDLYELPRSYCPRETDVFRFCRYAEDLKKGADYNQTSFLNDTATVSHGCIYLPSTSLTPF